MGKNFSNQETHMIITCSKSMRGDEDPDIIVEQDLADALMLRLP